MFTVVYFKVLKKTGDYISQMQQKISKHQTEISDLKTQNAELEVEQGAWRVGGGPGDKQLRVKRG